MFRFRFELCPLDEVAPWGNDQPTLHWFGLTEGWYWLEVHGHELLRRTRFDHPYPYVDYYLGRLWEDVTVLTPDVLEPVPADLQVFIATDSTAWARDPLEFMAGPAAAGTEALAADRPDHPAVTASIWHGQHALDFGYLRNAPQVRFWRTTGSGRDEVTVDWRHEDDGEIGFTAGSAARFTTPTAAYLEAVRTLDSALMTAMGQRVAALERRAGIPGVDLDLAQLRHDHEDRRHWLARNLDRVPETDWTAVRHGARLLLDQGR